MIHLGDVTKIDGAVAPLVDVIIGGSPCQDLSVAGKRAGLDGARSGLFMEQIRIIKEMRRRCENAGANEIRPRYFVWENVPGAFSSNGGEDFRTVLEEICRIVDERAHVPRPHTGGGTLWRTSGAIMGDGYSVAWRVLDAQFWGVPQRRRRIALVADFGGSTAPEILFVSNSLSGRTQAGRTTRQGTPSDIEGGTGTTIGFNYLMGSKAGSVGAATEQSGTLKAGCNDHAVCLPKPIGFNYTNSITAKTNPTVDKVETLRASGGAEGYIVRRLTPLECERLQGFPDGWTDIGEWIDEKGKTRQTTDAVRYKALGNSIAIPPWKWVLKRLCANYERDATMASLFDGIGGFPLIWEQLNGRGSCLWASEIEEFPIAVTKRHFQGVTA